ncbi:MAG TPA: PAS domain S-box protein [Steroidobacteraceae bacterium]|nr:PAS domain S-box protein [Steroidobacteraceae bacterium]
MGARATVREPALQAILDAAVDGVVLIDHRGVIQAFNRAAERLFGWSSAEAIGRNVGILMSEAERAGHDEHIARYLKTGEPHIIGRGREVMAQRKGGGSFPVFLSVGVVPGGATPQFLGFVHDLSPEREAQEQQQLLRERLILVSRLAMVGEIASGIAHEVNQPLAAITNYAWACQRLLGTSAPDLGEVRSALQEIGTQAVRAADTIRRLRQIARSPETRREPTSVNALITAITELTRADAARHGVRCELELAERLPPLNLDGTQIQQALLNLLWNALQALSGSSERPREIRISTALGANHEVEITLCDNGGGVSPEVAERLFEPFFTTKPEGTGLGLAMSRRIAQLHGGTLSYRANSPAGACFIMRLPVD